MSVYVVYGGWQDTIIDAQVIRPLENIEGSEVYFLCQSMDSFIKSRQKKRAYSGSINIHLIPIVSPYLILDKILNNFIIYLYILVNNKSFKDVSIYCRTEYSAVYFPRMRGVKQVVWDIRGDLMEEIVTLKKDNLAFQFLNIFGRFEKKLIKYQRVALKRSSECLVVSDALKTKIFSRIGSEINLPTNVQPCTVSEEFQFSLEVRLHLRRELKISPMTTVGVYCGSLDSYHIGPNLVDIFKFFLQSGKALIVLTSDPSKVEKLIENVTEHKNFYCYSVRHRDVYRYLHAADFAIFDRYDQSLTQVSSPVKIAEYLSSGLEIIGTVPVAQVNGKFPERVLTLDTLMNRELPDSRGSRMIYSKSAYNFYKDENLVKFLSRK